MSDYGDLLIFVRTYANGLLAILITLWSPSFVCV